ncbi:hypothetical protein [Micromonospora sp. WMMD1082]|uniref:alpha/beta hydrolase n=1 Tax=Micromonospora sp. WMMD1082 TaxID=3016104 RepID=UPI0024178827|nr:hypothetical protein [Micromonospora sp. WMMD1082]MDG4795720.1 hypothetical protein [Micromonospora sp. WMMD1082]
MDMTSDTAASAKVAASTASSSIASTVVAGSSPELSFDAGVAAARATIAADQADASVRSDATSCLLSHGERRAKAVLMLHGYTHDPRQLVALAEHFHARGYNVYVPRAPLHGLLNTGAHARVTAAALREHATEAWTITAALGEEAGVIGVSAGAVLATWLAQRPGYSVRRLLALAPFYRPHRTQAHPMLTTLSRALFGSGLLPDRSTSRGYSYAAVAQYLGIVAGYPRRPGASELSRVAVAVSSADQVADPTTALCLPATLARHCHASFGMYVVPPTWQLGHDIVSPPATGGYADRLHDCYFRLYDTPSSTSG